MKTKLLLFVIFANTFSFAQNVLELNPTNFPVTQPCGFTNFNNKLFYIGANTTYGREMWTTDGIQAGNALLKDIGNQYNIAALSAFQDQTAEAVYGKNYVFNGKLYFTINGGQVWTSDGTTAGTIPFDTNNTTPGLWRYFKEFNGRLYFTAYNGITGTEVWSTDGTVAGTTLLKDINPNSGQSVYYDPGYTVMNNKMYFKADDGVHGMELWSTDGTSSGTNMVLDINLGTYDTSSIGTFIRNGTFLDEHFKVVGNKFYFRGYQANNPNDSFSLYVSDGTAAGTQRISYLNGYGDSANYDGVGITVLNNTLYYFGSKNITSPFPGGGTANQIGIFTTDGTTAGTILIKDLGTSGSYIGDNGWSDNGTTPNSMRINNGKAYFLRGLKLWVTDGTAAGTIQITNDSYDAFDYQKRLVSQVFDSKLYFIKNAGSTATQGIYSTDGTVVGTTFAGKTTNQNQANASTLGMTTLPSELKAYGNSLYFSAGYNFGAASLWRLRNPTLANEQFVSNDFKMSLYPNPTSNNLNLNLPNSIEKGTLKIVSISGQTVLEHQNLNGTDFNFDVASLNSGLYLLQVSDSQNNFSSKFIKQ